MKGERSKELKGREDPEARGARGKRKAGKGVVECQTIPRPSTAPMAVDSFCEQRLGKRLARAQRLRVCPRQANAPTARWSA